jgi:hypothetical protein
MHVLYEEQKIVFGGQKTWVDVEADEVDLGKELLLDSPNGNKARWEQWDEMVQLGQPGTLVLYRLSPKITSRRSPRLEASCLEASSEPQCGASHRWCSRL